MKMAASKTSKADALKSQVEAIKSSTKKKLNKVNSLYLAEEKNRSSECVQIKKELDGLASIGVDNNAAYDEAFQNKASDICNRMKDILQRELALQASLLKKIDVLAYELESKVSPLKKEISKTLDFSEQDRVQLIQGVEKVAHEVQEKRAFIVEMGQRLNREMAVLSDNTPEPSAPREETLNKLKTSLDTLSRANDPEVVREQMLASLKK